MNMQDDTPAIINALGAMNIFGTWRPFIPVDVVVDDHGYKWRKVENFDDCNPQDVFAVYPLYDSKSPIVFQAIDQANVNKRFIDLSTKWKNEFGCEGLVIYKSIDDSEMISVTCDDEHYYVDSRVSRMIKQILKDEGIKK